MIPIIDTQTQYLRDFISSGGEGSGGGHFLCLNHFGPLVSECSFGVTSTWWLLAERKENIMEVGGRKIHNWRETSLEEKTTSMLAERSSNNGGETPTRGEATLTIYKKP